MRNFIIRILEFGKERIRFFLNPQSEILIPHLSAGQQWILLALAFLILGLLCFRFYVHPSLPPSEVKKEFVVEVAGEVRKPGIYLFQTPPALAEAIEKAGGMKEEARLETQGSEPLETGTLITVAKKSRITLGRMAANKLLVFSIPLDLNRVTAEDLCLVPGIGGSLAREIAAYRERRKGFNSVDELKNVKGIGEKKYEGFKKYFVVKR